MNGFHGEFEATIDGKGRFLLPSALKKQLSEGENRFMLSRGFEKCITLYPMDTWDKEMERFNTLNQFDPKVRQFTRQFLGGATEIELDTAGRMLMPASFKQYASLERDVVISAVLDKFEIWDAPTYKKMYEEMSPEEYSRLAKEVMVQP
jgi:MraZ protein